MSKTLSAVAREEFDSEVKQAYQGASMLRPTVTLRTNVVGDTYHFRRMGKGLANQKPSQADVTPMDVAHTKPQATLSNWNAPEYTDIFDQAEVNFDEQAELAKAIAMALGRREDQLVIDALDAEATPAGVIAAGGANLTVAKVNEASKFLFDKGVPSTERHFLHSADGLESMLNEEKATSADYMTVKNLVNGTLSSAFSFEFHCIETRDEGGLSVAANIRKGFAYHKEAIGLAVGIDMRTDVDWVPQKTSWLANGMLKAGSVSRDGDGIVEVNTDET